MSSLFSIILLVTGSIFISVVANLLASREAAILRSSRYARSIVVVSIVAFILTATIVIGLSPKRSESYTFIANVVDARTNAPIRDARVTLDTVNTTPQSDFTDSVGIVVFSQLTSAQGTPARIIIQASGYPLYEANVVLTPSTIPFVIKLSSSA